MLVGTIANAQVFTSNLSSWDGNGNPTDWFGSKTTIAQSGVIEVPAEMYGSSAAQLVNATTSHKRFTTMRLAVTAGETYEIKMWVKAAAGDLRTNFYNVTDDNYGSYNSYLDLSTESNGSLVMLSQSVTLPATCDSAEFILSLRNTDGNTDIILDSVSIETTAPPVATAASIYDIQYTTNGPLFVSPYNGQLVETGGTVTAVQYNGYYLQDGTTGYNGIFVLDFNNTPSIGDVVEVTGTVDEYYEFTTVKNISVYNVTGTATVPTALTMTSAALQEEQYEGMLVRVTGAECTADTTSNNFGEWTINDGTAALIVDNKMHTYGPVVGLNYNVTGVLDYSFDVFKLLPRDVNDIVLATGINELNNIALSTFPNPVKDVVTIKTSLNSFTVELVDITGKFVSRTNTTSNVARINASELTNGVYFYSIYDRNNVLVGTSKFVVAK